MPIWAQIVLSIVASLLGSSGLFTIILHFLDKKDAKNEMLLGLGHDRIIFLEKMYIERGYITPDEYENLHDYLYLPYKKMGGNGTAEKLMKTVDTLPTTKPTNK